MDSIKIGKGGKKLNVKTENADKLLDNVRKNLKSTYSFKLKDRRVKVVFSDNPNAQTIENVLVKIATRRMN